MTLTEVFALVDRDTKLCRHDNEYRIPAGKLRCIVELAYLAGQAEHRADVANHRPSNNQRGPYRPRFVEVA